MNVRLKTAQAASALPDILALHEGLRGARGANCVAGYGAFTGNLTTLLTYTSCAIVSSVSESEVNPESNWSWTSQIPTLPGSGDASSTLAVFPPASEDRNAAGWA